jgi:hypothetical protein
MSVATLEIPNTSSQLYFPWISDAEAPITSRFSDGCDSTTELTQRTSKPAPVVINSAVNRAFDAAAGSEFLSADQKARVASPVRIGSVMLKLLRQYGITDEEIEDGLAAFASRTR